MARGAHRSVQVRNLQISETDPSPENLKNPELKLNQSPKRTELKYPNFQDGTVLQDFRVGKNRTILVRFSEFFFQQIQLTCKKKKKTHHFNTNKLHNIKLNLQYN